MLWRAGTCRLSLSRPPAILRMSGRAVHGLQEVERYRLEKFWCLNLYQGRGELNIGGQTFAIEPGYASITWPGVEMAYRYQGRAILTWVHFLPGRGRRLAEIPVMQDLGRDFDRLRMDLQSVASLYRSQPQRAVARLWDILWRLTPWQEPGKNALPGRHPALARAMDVIDGRIADPLEVRSLAGEIGLSQTHLNRLFRSAVGMTAGQYLRTRRLELAHHLITHTTLPIKSIAAQVGIPDPHHFNKLMRRYAGKAPSRLR